ncbi:MAG: hypothetical protein OSB09_01355 [Planctomycetota bacterium]|nr:hypothetical protein [Planctomycetota bacterium]
MPRFKISMRVTPLSVMLLSVMLLSIMLLSGQSAHAQDPGYIFKFDTSSSGPSGATVTSRALIDNLGGDLAGWSIAICHDANMEVVEVLSGTASTTANSGGPADFDELTLFPGFGVRQGVVVNFVGINNLPSGQDHEAIVMQTLLLGPDDTFASIQYCTETFPGDSAASDNLAVAPGGVAITPTTEDGLIEIGGLLPFLLSANPSAASVEQGIDVDVQILVDTPDINYGFSFGFAHSGAALLLTGADLGAALSAFNGGAGPEYLLIDIEPEGADGLIVACLYSISDISVMSAGTDQELMVAHYQALDTAPIGSTSLNFTSDLVPQAPSPPTAIVFSLGNGGSAVVNTSGTSIQILEGVVGVQFTRGDFDGNGNLDLGDSVNLLSYMFSGGAASLCEKVADIDDNGIIVLGDPILLLSYMFSGGPPPQAPFETCGIDPTEDDLTCEVFDSCP